MNTFRELVLADLARAHRMAKSIQPNPIDPQFRIATPSGDWWIAMTMSEEPSEQAEQYALIADWMTLKQAFAFTLAVELHEPNALLCAGISRDDAIMAMHDVAAATFEPHGVQWYGRESADPQLLALLRAPGAQVLPQRIAELERTFGPGGAFPAVQIGKDADKAGKLN